MRRETTSGYDVKVECYFSPECGTEKELRKNLDEALKAEALKADLTFRRIEQAVARAMGLKGSPAVLINGSELQPAQMEGFGWRVFRDESGRTGSVPTVSVLRTALRAAKAATG